MFLTEFRYAFPQKQPGYTWRFLRGALLGFLSGCALGYALIGQRPSPRVHLIIEPGPYVVAMWT